jgi:hypothetical protein
MTTISDISSINLPENNISAILACNTTNNIDKNGSNK